jgi:hypothetical protein
LHRWACRHEVPFREPTEPARNKLVQTVSVAAGALAHGL